VIGLFCPGFTESHSTCTLQRHCYTCYISLLYTATEIKRAAKCMQDLRQQPSLKLYGSVVGLRALVFANLVIVYARTRLLMWFRCKWFVWKTCMGHIELMWKVTFTTVGWLCDMNVINISCNNGALWLIHRFHKEKAALKMPSMFMDSLLYIIVISSVKKAVLLEWNWWLSICLWRKWGTESFSCPVMGVLLAQHSSDSLLNYWDLHAPGRNAALEENWMK